MNHLLGTERHMDLMLNTVSLLIRPQICLDASCANEILVVCICHVFSALCW